MLSPRPSPDTYPYTKSYTSYADLHKLQSYPTQSIYNAVQRQFPNARKTKVLIGIFSASGIAKYDHRREYIRNTFVNPEEEHLCSLQEYMYRVDHDEIESLEECEIIYTFVIGGGKWGERPPDHGDDEPLTLTQDSYGNSETDCTYLNIRENMEKGKSATWLKYASLIGHQYGIDYVMKVDDDTVTSVTNLVQFTRDELPPAPYNTRIYGGPPRPSVSAQTMYAAGELYFMSLDLAYYVGNELTAQERAEMRTAIKSIEDLDMATYVYSHPYPIKYLNLNLWKIWEHSQKTKKENFYKYKWAKMRIRKQTHQRKAPFQWGWYCPAILKGDVY